MATVKPVPIAALLVLLVAADASILLTTVTTVEGTGESQQQQQCHTKIIWHQIEACRPFLMSVGAQQLGMSVLSSSSTQQHLCCQQLENVEKQCRCDTIKKMWRQIELVGRAGPGYIGGPTMREQAQILPTTCGLEPQVCQLD